MDSGVEWSDQDEIEPPNATKATVSMRCMLFYFYFFIFYFFGSVLIRFITVYGSHNVARGVHESCFQRWFTVSDTGAYVSYPNPRPGVLSSTEPVFTSYPLQICLCAPSIFR